MKASAELYLDPVLHDGVLLYLVLVRSPADLHSIMCQMGDRVASPEYFDAALSYLVGVKGWTDAEARERLEKWRSDNYTLEIGDDKKEQDGTRDDETG